MTKVTILGQEEVKKEKKKIEFCVHINATKDEENKDRCTEPARINQPSCWDNIVLLKKDVEKYYDLMYAYDNDGITCALFLGHFNDGEV